MVRYPDWCCQHCGEPLRTVPCLNCIQLDEMEDDEGPKDESSESEQAVVSASE